MEPTAADPASRGAFVPLLRALSAAGGLDAEELEQRVWLRAAAERRPSDLPSRLRALTLQEFDRLIAEQRLRELETEAFAALAARRPQGLDTEDARELRAAVARTSGRCPELLRALLQSPQPDYPSLAAELAMPCGSIGPVRSRCLAQLRRLLAVS